MYCKFILEVFYMAFENDEMFDLDGLDLDALEREVNGQDEVSTKPRKEKPAKEKAEKPVKPEYDVKIDYPHIKMDTNEFKSVLSIARVVCSATGKDIASRAIYLKADKDNGKVIAKVTDFDVYVTVTVPLLNKDNILEDELVIPCDYLMRLFVAVPAKTIFFKDDEGIKLHVDGGAFDVRTFDVDTTKYDKVDDLEDIGKVKENNLLHLLKVMSNPAAAAISPIERRIFITKNCSFVHSLWGILKYQFSMNEEFDLKLKDISILRVLLRDSDNDITFKRNKADTSVMVVEGKDFVFRFLVSSLTFDDDIRTMLDNLNGTPSTISNGQLSTLVGIASNLSTATGDLVFKYSDDGVAMDMPLKSGKKSQFNLPGTKVEGDGVAKVNGRLLNTYLSSFAGMNDINFTVTNNGIQLESVNKDFVAGILAIDED